MTIRDRVRAHYQPHNSEAAEQLRVVIANAAERAAQNLYDERDACGIENDSLREKLDAMACALTGFGLRVASMKPDAKTLRVTDLVDDLDLSARSETP
jgi:type IV pilus biogenesis protein CpaD/CtpE